MSADLNANSSGFCVPSALYTITVFFDPRYHEPISQPLAHWEILEILSLINTRFKNRQPNRYYRQPCLDNFFSEKLTSLFVMAKPQMKF